LISRFRIRQRLDSGQERLIKKVKTEASPEGKRVHVVAVIVIDKRMLDVIHGQGREIVDEVEMNVGNEYHVQEAETK